MIVTRNSYRFFIETMRRTGHSASQIYRLLQKAWQEMAPSRAAVFRLFRELEDGTKALNKAWVGDICEMPKLPRRTISDKKLMVVVAMTLGGM